MKTKLQPLAFHRILLVVCLGVIWAAHNVPAAMAGVPGLGQAVNAPALVWNTGGAVPWFSQDDVTHDNVGAAEGNVLVEYDRSWIETIVSGAGQISFFWKCSTVWPDYDALVLYLDGERFRSIPGDADWQQLSFSVPDGAHTLHWVFEVDSEPSPSYGAWLDEFQFTPASTPPLLKMPLARGRVVAWGTGSFGVTNVPEDLGPVAAVAAGMYHSMALKADGTVVAWGGAGTDYQEAGVVPPGLSNVVAISAGAALSIALKANSTVVSWGIGADVPSGLNDVIAISAGGYHGLALRRNGTVVGWGQNGGQTSPPDDLTNAVAIAAGGHHSLALRADGTVVGFGYNGSGETVPPAGLSNVVAIAAGESHSLALRADGTVVAWGWNYFNETNVPAGLSNVVAIAAGDFHNLALCSDGSVAAWGRGDYGQTNLPSRLTNVLALDAGTGHSLALVEARFPEMPKIIGEVVAWGSGSWGVTNVPPDLGPVAAVSAGMYHNLALRTNGTVVAWAGAGTDYQEAGFVPPGLSNVVAISAGYALSIALKANGTLAVWGVNGCTDVPPGLNDVVAISAGGYHGLALHGNGRVVGWGQSMYGQISPPEDLNAVAIAAGGHHSLALRADGTVVGFGYDGSGETVPPAGLSNVIAIAAGQDFSLALKDNGTVAAWGRGNSGQTNVPPGLSGVVAISAGDSFALALKNDGTVIGWGRGSYGETNMPAGLTNALAIDAGSTHGLALVPISPPLTLAGAVDATNLVWTTGGAVDWFPQRAVTHDVSDAAQGTVRVAGDRSWIATTINGPARVSFFWKCSTYWPEYDRLAFYIDGTLISSIPGNADWQEASFLVPPGERELKWVFEVDSEPTSGHYNAWLDQVTIDTNVAVIPPHIVQQPTSRTVPVGGDAIFTVGVEGTPPLRYQWKFNGYDLEGETGSQLVLTSVQPDQAGQYCVVVSNNTVSAYSDQATLAIIPTQTAWAWAGQGGGGGYVNGGGSVAVDHDGNLLVTGSFSEEGHFGSFVLPNNWVTRFFLAKYDPAGNVLWVRTTTGAPYSASYGSLVSLDAAGNIYVAGTFADAMGNQQRARISFGEHSITNVGWFEDVFLVKYDPSGEALWARRMGGPRQEFVYDLAVDAAGNAWITGGFGQSRYDTSGNLTWVQSVSGLVGSQLALDPSGNAYLSGRCQSAITLDGFTVGPGLFIVKYSPASEVLWTMTGASNHVGSSYSLVCDAGGGLLVAGGFQGTVNFGGLSLTASEANAVFLAKFNAAGDATWAREIASSTTSVNAQRLFFDGTGQLYFAGGFDGIVSVGSQLFSSRGSDGVVLAQLDATGEQHWAIKLPAGAGTGGRSFAADATGRIYNTGSFSGTVDFGGNSITCGGPNAMYLARLDGNFASRPATALRQLPAVCQPNVSFTVQINVTPDAANAAYAVADQPPANWTVSHLSNGGGFDVTAGKVKFGPFRDSTPRTLTYDLTAPLNARGSQFFAGTVSADGINTTLGGAGSIETTPFLHPADNTPADSTMTATEVDAYSAAWRQGQSWPTPPNPIPIEYVTRAALLAENDGCYVVDPSKAPPLCWGPCSSSLVRANPRPKMAAPSSAATSALPVIFVPGESLPVALAITPAPDVKAFAVEDIVPAGWAVTAISDGGEMDTTRRKVKWGPFPGSTPRTLTYQVVPPSSASGSFVFAGCVSFDGANIAITGQRHTSSSCRLASQGQLQAGQFRLNLTTPLDAILQVQSSTNLTDWLPLTLLTNTTGSLQFQDPAPAAKFQRFYRAILLQ